METERFSNVWDALEDTPEEAANMTFRADLMLAVERKVRAWNVTQAQAAKRLGITQPRLNDLLKGKIAKFSLDALIGLARRAGLTVRLDIDEAA